MTLLARLPQALGLLAALVLQTRAANTVDMLSFGIGNAVLSNNQGVNGWHVSGSDGHQPDIYSDRITLTPISPGSKRGAAWAEKSSPYSEWSLEVAFRASGPDRGSGNLQIWYAKDGEKEVATSSVYTVGSFDGLVVVVDQYGSRGGSVRGFLNDGTKSYNALHSVDQLAFGHCDYVYRNQGAFGRVTLRQTSDSFEVLVDDQPCFRTQKIKLPSGYQFGLTAASAETPDSFEVSQFVVSASTSSDPLPPPPSTKNNNRDTPSPPRSFPDETPDKPASDYRDQTAQFEDLHTRLQALHHQLNGLVHDFESVKLHQEDKHNALVGKYLQPMHDFQDQIHERIRNIEGKVNNLDSESFRKDVKALHDSLKVNHESIMYHLPNLGNIEGPRIGLFVFIVCAFQLLLAGSYVVYKRRKNSGPKKYL